MMDVPGWLQGAYLFTTVFGGGVTAIDLLGLLGEHGHDHAEHNGHTGEASADAHGDTPGQSSLLIVLRYLRIVVYFSLGFGPLGLVASATGCGFLGSLAWALSGGLLAALLARIFFRWQQHDVDSTVQDVELLAERAVVLVPLSHTTMGRVRLTLAQSVVERYALAEQAGEAFATEDIVEVVRVTDDCVYVQRATGTLHDLS